jgi:hypothetical protein
MVSNPWLYQLALIALVWLFLMLYGRVWRWAHPIYYVHREIWGGKEYATFLVSAA